MISPYMTRELNMRLSGMEALEPKAAKPTGASLLGRSLGRDRRSARIGLDIRMVRCDHRERGATNQHIGPYSIAWLLAAPLAVDGQESIPVLATHDSPLRPAFDPTTSNDHLGIVTGDSANGPPSSGPAAAW
jgi:hypothetical protein